MAINVGDKIPEATLMKLTDKGPAPVKTGEFFKGRKVVVFALPGAFTPTCSNQHLPGFIKSADDFKGKGVDEIACLSVNDAFVMGAWGKQQGADGQFHAFLGAHQVADIARVLFAQIGHDFFTQGVDLAAERFHLGTGQCHALALENNRVEMIYFGIHSVPP